MTKWQRSRPFSIGSKYLASLVAVALVCACATLDMRAGVAAAPAAVTMNAADGVTVFGESYPGPSPVAPIIVLLHQAGSSKAEYAQIAPRLNSLGYNALAVDLRSGGDLFGAPNETATHYGKPASYVGTLPDIEAAIVWAKQRYPKSPIYLWGSSYSAALVFVVAAKHPEISAVLAFSPAEYLNHKTMVRDAAREVHAYVFIDSASIAEEIGNAKAIYDAIPGSHKTQFIPKHSVHGSSTLLVLKDPDGANENWAAVTAFLRSLPRS